MTLRKEYIRLLINSLKVGMLPSIAKRDSNVIACMKKAYIELPNSQELPIEFELGKFFDAAICWGEESGLDTPLNMDYQKYFDEFCLQLMNPWPIETLKRAGLNFQITHKSNSRIRDKYKITNI